MQYKNYYVYILASKKRGTLYTGITSDLIKRIFYHKQKIVAGFTKKYHLQQLVIFEIHQDIVEAIKREKQIKKWNRDWKIRIIEEANPAWEDLFYKILGVRDNSFR